MASTTRKAKKKSNAKPRRPVAKKSQPKQGENIQSLQRALDESLAREAATSDILRMIARSPAELQSVLDAIAERAARLCDADDAVVWRVDGEVRRRVAHFGQIPTGSALAPVPDRGGVIGRAIMDCQTIHVHDLQATAAEFPRALGMALGLRTILATPLLHGGVAIGAIAIRRREVRPFSDRQIKLLEIFADQAVIAIENARLIHEQQARNRELIEALEQQTATSEILRVIASSPTDLQPVLDAVAESASRLCEASDALIRRVDGDVLAVVAHYGQIPHMSEADSTTLSRGSVSGRAVIDRQTIHIHDLAAAAKHEFPVGVALAQRFGYRTVLVTPLMRQDVPIGAIIIRRLEVRPFTEKQIALLKTFADQAVIAIENVRLFKEIQERNGELREALEHQTATAEVLGIISRSPTDVQPVLDAIVESAARVCGIDDLGLRLREENSFVARARFGSIPIPIDRVEISIDEPHHQWVRDHGTLHVPDVLAQNDFPMLGTMSGWRTFLAVPLSQRGHLIGILTARRTEVLPFTPAQIKLLETFADQAVIAIENARLFQELKESLEQQTATSEILGVIASSPTDLQPVMDAIAENAARLCEASDALIHRIDGDFLKRVANYGPLSGSPDESGGHVPIDRGLYIPGRAVIDRTTIHIHDLTAEPEDDLRARFARSIGVRTVLATPLLREGVPIGTIMIRRTEVRPFTEKQIKLLETFADQAVIAIENVRLFKEIQERNAELREALEHQTATAEVLGIISRSPTDVQPVLDAIVESAARVCGIDDVVLRLREGNFWIPRAHFGSIPIRHVEMSVDQPWIHWVREHGTLHIPDVREPHDPPTQIISDWRTFLAAPLRQQGELVGTLSARRTEVRPFSQAQIKLLETFADQAVIALENVRLFQELKESLEQQTATSEILGVIASSPTDIQPVLNVVVENAVRVCGAEDALIWLMDGGGLRLVAKHGSLPSREIGAESPLRPETPLGRAVIERQTIHIHDLPAVETEFPGALGLKTGDHTVLVAPLLREGNAIGVIHIRRKEVRPFSDKQVALLKTFADQAVIAIENVRLFKELQERNAELREALEHQTATAEVLGIISRSPTDVQPVLDAIVESAARVCGVDDVVLRLREGDSLVSRAHFGPIPVPANRSEINIDEPQYRWMREHGTLHVPDISKWNDFSWAPVPVGVRSWRSRLTAPLLHHGELIGVLNARRIEVRPFTPSADKAPRNLCQPGGDCPRKRPLVPRTRGADARVGSIGRRTQSVRRSRTNCQFYSRSSDSAQHHRWPCGATLRY
jgi:GAF domain-containing protein